jgi:hypothetical protein
MMASSPRRTADASQPAPTPRDAADPLSARPVPRSQLLWLTAGTAGTLLFPLIYLIEGATLPGYDPWRETISALAFGPAGWMQQLNFALCGVSVLVSAYAWRRILTGGVCARWYPALRGIEGLALVAIAAVKLDPWHTVLLIVIVSTMTLALFVIARRFWRRSLWRGWAAFSIGMGLWLMTMMSLFGASLAPHSALGAYTGLFERLATNADTIWSVAIVTRLWTRRAVGV